MEEFQDKVIIDRARLQRMEEQLREYEKNGYLEENLKLEAEVKKLRIELAEYKEREDHITYLQERNKEEALRLNEIERKNNELSYNIDSLERKNKTLIKEIEELKDKAKKDLAEHEEKINKLITELNGRQVQVDNLLYENKLLRKYRFHFWKRFKK